MTGVSLLPRVLEKIFAVLMNNNDPAASTQPEAVKALRRHAASLMVRLGIKYPLLLLPVFDQINSTVQSMSRAPQQINKLERTVLQEALLVISNHFCDYERQSNFVLEVLRDADTEWSALTGTVKSGADFVRFAGLNQSPDLLDSDTLENRQSLKHSVNTVLGVIRRCSWPEDPDRASRGGFVVGLTESGNPICQNPATRHVVPLLPHILSLMRTLNALFAPDAMALLSDGFKTVYGMSELEKKMLMVGSVIITDPMDPEQLYKVRGAFDKMQTYMTQLFDNCYHMLGSAGPSLGRELYQLHDIATVMIDSIFAGLEHVPDHRLRPITRVFFKPFVYSCPPAFYESVLVPMFSHLAPISKL